MGKCNECIGGTVMIQQDDKCNVIEKYSDLNIKIYGKNNNIYIGKNVKNPLGLCQLVVECGDNNTIRIEDGVTYGNDCKVKCENNSKIFIGKDCMLSNEVNIICRNNEIILEEHIWLGLRSSILSGTYIGTGSILGACAVVMTECSNNCLLVGNPAKIVKNNVAWHRLRDERNIENIQKEYRLLTKEKQSQYEGEDK